jgi:hypothetical protein
MEFTNYDNAIELVRSAFDLRDEIGFEGNFKIYDDVGTLILETDDGAIYEIIIVDNKYMKVF